MSHADTALSDACEWLVSTPRRLAVARSDFAGTVKDVISGLSIMAFIIGGGMLACGVFG